MASPADEGLPALPPIKTGPLTPSLSASAAVESAEDTKAAAAATATAEEENQEPSTPTSEESRLRPPTECPPAPRKPPAPRLSAKRKSRPSPTSMRVCVAVPRDLSTVFRSMPMPPEKRIRAS